MKLTRPAKPNSSDNVLLLTIFFNEKWIITGCLGTDCSTLVTEGILLFAILLKTTFVIKKSGLKAGIINLYSNITALISGLIAAELNDILLSFMEHPQNDCR
ncbi:hypothetical protein AB6846_27830 [Serratia proteamaculans]